MQKKTTLLLVISVVLFSCKSKVPSDKIESNTNFNSQEVVHQKDQKHWTYEGKTGPEHWIELEEKSDCNGERQSPINIIEINLERDSLLKPIGIFYSSKVKIHDVTNNGHSIIYNFEEGDYITLNDKKYDLIHIHFHEASEHTINGIRYPLEMHLVHVSKNNRIAVLAVLAKEGKSSDPFTFLENYLPVKNGKTKEINASFDLNLNLPDNREYYAYGGSLTTPPCTESVSWYVFKTPITVSLAQVKQLQKLMPLNNYRNEQQLHGRIVKHYLPQ